MVGVNVSKVSVKLMRRTSVQYGSEENVEDVQASVAEATDIADLMSGS